MEDETFNDDIENHFEQGGRPTFLIVLSILSGIAILSGVLGTISSITTPDETVLQLEQALEMVEDSGDEGVEFLIEDIETFVETSIANLKKVNYINLVLYLLEGFAVLLMFNLKKEGFKLYLICQVGFIANVYMHSPSSNVITTITLTYTVIISGIFILLYSLNLKHLK